MINNIPNMNIFFYLFKVKVFYFEEYGIFRNKAKELLIN